MVMVEALRVGKGVDLRPLCEQLRREGRPFRVYEAGGAQCLAVADEEAQVRVLALWQAGVGTERPALRRSELWPGGLEGRCAPSFGALRSPWP